MTVGFQVIDESFQPGSASLLVCPKGDVFIDAFENWTAQLGVWRHVFAVAFFPDFNSRHRITTLVNVGNLIGAIFGSVINRRTCNQRRMAHGQSTSKEIVHAVVLIVTAGNQIVSLVPGIEGRSEKRSGQVRRRAGDHFLVSSALLGRRRPRSGLYAV